MGQYERHVFVCTSGETCPTQGDTEKYVKLLRDGARKADGDAARAATGVEQRHAGPQVRQQEGGVALGRPAAVRGAVRRPQPCFEGYGVMLRLLFHVESSSTAGSEPALRTRGVRRAQQNGCGHAAAAGHDRRRGQVVGVRAWPVGLWRMIAMRDSFPSEGLRGSNCG